MPKVAFFGMKVNVVFGDDESQPQKGVAAVKKLISRDKSSCGWSVTIALLPLLTSEVCERRRRLTLCCCRGPQ